MVMSFTITIPNFLDTLSYLAAKTCYFGVGGSIKSFENFLKEDGSFSVEHCHKVEEGEH
jgi:hypothetical protein